MGVEPQVKRIGKYKSAGDQLLRSSMSEPQAEQLNAILEAIYEEFLTTVSEARGKTKEVGCCVWGGPGASCGDEEFFNLCLTPGQDKGGAPSVLCVWFCFV